MSYIYRREDDGELVTVDFETMMGQKDGYITLPDGVAAKRCVHLEQQAEKCKSLLHLNVQAEILSDGMGFTEHCLPDMQRHLAESGCTGIEFVPDSNPESHFYRVKAGSWNEWSRYVKSRGLVDRNSRNGGGQALSPDLLQRSAQRVLEAHPTN